MADGFGLGEADVVVAQPLKRPNANDDVTIKLSAPYSLRVRVLTNGGKVIEGARVTVIPASDEDRFSWDYQMVRGHDIVIERSDARGWAEFPSVAFGWGTVVIQAKGFARRTVAWAIDEDEFLVDLEPESRLVGTVLDDAEKPFRRAAITLSWGEYESLEIPIDEKDGHFVVDQLGAGQYSFAVSANNGPPDFSKQLHSEKIELEFGKTLFKEIRVKAP
jgi:hypothetical protein